MKIRKPRLSQIQVFTEPQKKGGIFSISCDPNFFYTVWQSIITMPDNSVPLLTPQTLLNIAVLVANRKFLFGMIGFHPIHQPRSAASMSRNIYFLEKMEE